MAAKISMGARREVMSAIAERHRSAERMEKGRILDELRAATGWHREHAVRALAKSGGDVTLNRAIADAVNLLEIARRFTPWH